MRGLDQTGLSQKAGPVVSDLRLSRDEPQASNKATSGSVDLYLAFDLLVGASDTHLAGASAERTVVVGSVSATPTGAMVVHPEIGQPSTEALRRRLDGVSRADVNRYVDAAAIVESMFGDGPSPTCSWSASRCRPARSASARRASSGRSSSTAWPSTATSRPSAGGAGGSSTPAGVRAAAGIDPKGTEAERDPVELRASDLEAYQSKRLARSYRSVVEQVRAREQEVAPGSTVLSAREHLRPGKGAGRWMRAAGDASGSRVACILVPMTDPGLDPTDSAARRAPLAVSDYGLIGDMRTAALVGLNGAIDWCCLPRFDSGSVFASLLDPERGGTWSVRPAVPWTSTQRYLPLTNILETTFRTAGGTVTVTDFMSVDEDGVRPGRIPRSTGRCEGCVDRCRWRWSSPLASSTAPERPGWSSSAPVFSRPTEPIRC